MKKEKKVIIACIFTMFLVILNTTLVNAADNYVTYDNLCNSFESGIGSAIRILGYLLEIIKVIVPIIVIVLGMVDFGKAFLSNDDKAITKAVGALTRRVIAGVVIFFTPTLILTIVELVDITDGIENNGRFNACTKCILNASENCPL